MHQVRYFLGVVRTRNFTRAAEECNVAQPSLTRAIKQLEAELGGDLFRRERPHAQITELGERMYPLLLQCYESALGARSLATSLKKGEIGSLRLALSRTVDLGLLVPHLREAHKHFTHLEFRFMRGVSGELVEFLKAGDAELALGDVGEAWERLDHWPLFTEGFQLAFGRGHRLANKGDIAIADVFGERLLRRKYCERATQADELLGAAGFHVGEFHEVASESDLVKMLEADFGVALVPRTTVLPATIARASIRELELRRTIHLYSVAGRQRSAVASMVMTLLRGADWSSHAS
jgi:DNA-binding transcriptional LysR family regulator